MADGNRNRRSFFGFETLVGSLLLASGVIGLITLKFQVQVFGFGEPGPDARTFPSVVLGILVLAVALRLFLNRKREETRIGPASDLARAMIVAIGILAVLFLMPHIGFFFSSAIIGIITAVAFGERHLFTGLALTIALAACVTYGAQQVLGIPLP